jgi:hypothetical protein
MDYKVHITYLKQRDKLLFFWNGNTDMRVHILIK